MERFIPYFNYWDELTVLIAGVLFLLHHQDRIRIGKNARYLFLSLGIVFLCGLAGNLRTPSFQPQIIAAVKDVIALAKFPLVLFFLNYRRSENLTLRYQKQAVLGAKIALVIMGFFAILGLFVNISVYTGEIRIVPCYTFFFNHPTFLVASLILISGVLLADDLHGHWPFQLLCGVLLFFSGRTKAYGMIVLILALLIIPPRWIKRLYYFSEKRFHIRKQFLPPLAIVGCLAVILITGDKIQEYMRWGMTAARGAMYAVGVMLAVRFFPIGSGFGTFGSSLSGEYYSNVYYDYGVSDVNGMSPDFFNYIADTYWPYVFGQFGVLGFVSYLYMLVQCFFLQFRNTRSYKRIMALLLLWGYALFASFAETYFTNATAIQLAIVLSVFLGTNDETKHTI